MNARILLFALGVTACIVFFSTKAVTAHGPGYGYGSGISIRPGSVNVPFAPSHGGHPGFYGGFSSPYHRPPVIIAPPPRPIPSHGSYYGPPSHHYHHGSPYRW